MLAVPIKEGFVMSRANYWWCMLLLFVLIAMIGVSIGASDARPYEVREMLTWVKVGGWIYLWSLGYTRLRDSGRKHTWLAIFAPTLIGMIWIGCLKDKENRNASTDDVKYSAD